MFENLISALKAEKRTIVFTEGEDARILEAASRLKKDGLMDSILVGNVEAVKAAAAKGGFDIEGVEIIDPETYAEMDAMVEKMVELRANDTDGAKEKHVPQVVVDGSTVHVKVGEVAHPMTPEHLIAFIVLVTEKGYQIAPLTAQDAPEATFALAAGDAPVKAYEYCNLHGLWVKEI